MTGQDHGVSGLEKVVPERKSEEIKDQQPSYVTKSDYPQLQSMNLEQFQPGERNRKQYL